MRECFDIVLDSQLGERRGTLTIDETGGAVRGAISLVGFENAVAGEEKAGVLYLRHELRTLVSRLKCRSVIRVKGDRLDGTVSTDGAEMKLHGVRTEAPESEQAG